METFDIIISATDIVQEIKDRANDNEPQYLFNGKMLDNEQGTNQLLQDRENAMIAKIINEFVGEQFENTIILAGAGASIINDYSNKDSLSGYSGKTVRELTKEIDEYLKENTNYLSLEKFSQLVNYFNRDEEYVLENVNIEDLLSKAESAKEYIKFESDGKKIIFMETLREIESKIKELCSLKIHSLHTHNQFLNKITSRRSSHSRVKIFTTNYDTLFEQAAHEEGLIVVDGFSYHFPRTFDPFMFDFDFVRRNDNRIMDEPDYVEKVIHLYKLHGSIDWEKQSDTKIVKKEHVPNPLMIYPRRNKFEQSYEAPYFEMFSRFQMELRKRNTLLITIGFSFADKHIQSIVENSMKNNTGLKTLVVDFSIEQRGFQPFIERAKKGYHNVMLFQSDFSGFTNLYLKQKAYSDEFFSLAGAHNE